MSLDPSFILARYGNGDTPVDILGITKKMGIKVYSSQDFGRDDLYFVGDVYGERSIMISTGVSVASQRFNLAKALYFYLSEDFNGF